VSPLHFRGGLDYLSNITVFFGTISAVEEEIRKLLDLAKWQHTPIRFLIMDLTLVHGLDFSSAEAFVRVQRLLAAKDVLLILCGAAPSGVTGQALQGVGLWSDRPNVRVEVFAGLNEALEWTENAYLTAFYENQKVHDSTPRKIDYPTIARPPFSLGESFANSPRRTHLAKAGVNTLHKGTYPLSSITVERFADSLHSVLASSRDCPHPTCFTRPAAPNPPTDIWRLRLRTRRILLRSGTVLHQNHSPIRDRFMAPTRSRRWTVLDRIWLAAGDVRV
jgi:hypothetical protein